MTDLYENFASYYQKLAEKRNHFEVQARILKKLFKELKIEKNHRILDAACGTGLVGNQLYKDGFESISLTDGSENMVDLTKKNVDSNIPMAQHHWENLDKYFDSNGKFDSIVIFGNSFAHASPIYHHQIFENIYSGLNNRGYFIFDYRNWSIDINGKDIQPNKPDNSVIQLGEISIMGRTLSVKNLIRYNYDEKKQVVSYIISDTKTKQDIETINLEYSIFSYDDILPKLETVGFNLKEIQIKNFVNWSYQVICCKK